MHKDLKAAIQEAPFNTAFRVTLGALAAQATVVAVLLVLLGTVLALVSS